MVTPAKFSAKTGIVGKAGISHEQTWHGGMGDSHILWVILDGKYVGLWFLQQFHCEIMKMAGIGVKNLIISPRA